MGQWNKFVFHPRTACLIRSCLDKPAEKVGERGQCSTVSHDAVLIDSMYTMVIKQHRCFVTSGRMHCCMLLCNWKDYNKTLKFTPKKLGWKIRILKTKLWRKFPKNVDSGPLVFFFCVFSNM